MKKTKLETCRALLALVGTTDQKRETLAEMIRLPQAREWFLSTSNEYHYVHDDVLLELFELAAVKSLKVFRRNKLWWERQRELQEIKGRQARMEAAPFLYLNEDVEGLIKRRAWLEGKLSAKAK